MTKWIIFSIISLLIFLCSCSLSHYQSGDWVDLGWTKARVIYTVEKQRKMLVKVNKESYYLVSYWDVVKRK